jgi:ribosomal protein S18 acetylase RimI-like enzyme
LGKLFTCWRARPSLDDYNGRVNFQLRDFLPQDFDTLWSIDQLCFAAGIAYSRPELDLYIRQPGSFTLVAESKLEEMKIEEMKLEEAPPGEAHHPLKPPARSHKNRPNPAILGFLVAEARRETGHLITIDILPEAQRSGLGSKLLNAAEERLRAFSCRRIYLETAVDNLPAIAFYERHKYFVVKTVPRYYSNGVDALLLEKNLLSPPQAG